MFLFAESGDWATAVTIIAVFLILFFPWQIFRRTK